MPPVRTAGGQADNHGQPAERRVMPAVPVQRTAGDYCRRGSPANRPGDSVPEPTWLRLFDDGRSAWGQARRMTPAPAGRISPLDHQGSGKRFRCNRVGAPYQHQRSAFLEHRTAWRRSRLILPKLDRVLPPQLGQLGTWARRVDHSVLIQILAAANRAARQFPSSSCLATDSACIHGQVVRSTPRG